MSDDEALTRHGTGTFRGPAHASPYPVSRLAPAHDIVDMAKQIAEADQMIGTVVSAKLQVIAEQIRSLQDKAREILADARDDAAIHRAGCRFRRRPGHTYHLYEKPDGSLYLSMLSPSDWRGTPPHTFVGSYRLEADMSWTPAGEAGPAAPEELKALVGIIEGQEADS